MTTWTPELRTEGPKYLAIFQALADDVESGRLRPGDRLPAQRELADRLGVTVGTVSRAYAEAERRGLLRGEVGRGTYVLEPGSDEPIFRDHGLPEDPSTIDLSHNLPFLVAGDEESRYLDRGLEEILRRCRRSELLGYQPPGGASRHRTAGAQWIGRSGLPADADRVLVSPGVNHGLSVVLSVLLQPGDTLLVESLTYPGIKALAGMLRLRLAGVAMDRHGMRPEALEAACRARAPRALYCVPTLQNPTASVMPEGRRREIAEIARAQGLPILEDDCYGFLHDSPPPPICRFAPELGFYFASLAKSLAPGLRIAYLQVPAAFVDRIASGIQTSTWMAAPLMSELAATWVLDGSAAEIVDRVRAEVAARQRIAAQLLDGQDVDTHPHSYHLWLHLPEPWRGLEFAEQARTRGVLVNPAESFAVGRQEAPHAVRVCLGAPAERRRMEDGLRILREVLDGVPACASFA